MRGTIKEFAPKSAVDLFYLLKFARWRLPLRQKYQPFVDNKYGIEIGGPSSLFRNVLPVYQFVAGLDGVNFSSDTVWEGRIKAGNTFNYLDGRSGRQYISEAADLSEIATAHYDFLLSSNCLEHVANAIKALTEWKRVIKTGGALVLVLPNKQSNFDHRRPVHEVRAFVGGFRARRRGGRPYPSRRDSGAARLTHGPARRRPRAFQTTKPEEF